MERGTANKVPYQERNTMSLARALRSLDLEISALTMRPLHLPGTCKDIFKIKKINLEHAARWHSVMGKRAQIW